MSVDLDLAYSSAVDVASRIAAGELSPVDVVENSLARIEQVQPHLNCFTTVWADSARAEARAAVAALAAGRPLPPLHGVPIALKETTPIAGLPLSSGSWAHEQLIADRDSAIVGAMRRAGAIVVGITTSPEFAHSSITDTF